MNLKDYDTVQSSEETSFLLSPLSSEEPPCCSNRVVDLSSSIFLESTEAEIGYVYLLTHPLMTGICKIGFTTDLKRRIHDLNASTSLPLPFEFIKAWEVENYREAERYIHLQLEDCRVNEKREFFSIKVGKALELLDHVCEGFAKDQDEFLASKVRTDLVPLLPDTEAISSLLSETVRNKGLTAQGVSGCTMASKSTVRRFIKGSNLSQVIIFLTLLEDLGLKVYVEGVPNRI